MKFIYFSGINLENRKRTKVAIHLVSSFPNSDSIYGVEVTNEVHLLSRAIASDQMFLSWNEK